MTPVRTLRTFQPFAKKTSIYLGLTRTFLAAVVFFVPLFFIPGLTDLLELPKAGLFVILTLAAAVCWSLAWVMTGEVRWRHVPGQWFLLTLLAASIASTIWSVRPVTSLLGVSGYYYDTLPFIAAAVVFVLLTVQVMDHRRDSRMLLEIFAVSLGIVALQVVLQSAGASPFPSASLRSTQFFIAGNSAVALSVLMALLVLISSTVIRQTRSLVWKLLGSLAVLLGLLVLLALDASVGWLSLAIGIVVMLVTSSVKPLVRFDLLMGAGVLVIALAGFLLPTRNLVKSKIVLDAQIDSRTSWSIATATVKAKPILGSGPATFYYDFLKYRPVAFNASPLAGAQFIKGMDVVSTTVPSLGLVGALAFLGAFFWMVVLFVKRGEDILKRATDDWRVPAAAFGGLVAVLSGFFFATGTVAFFGSAFVLYAILALILTTNQTPKVGTSPLLRITGTVSFLVAVTAVIVCGIWMTRLVLADRGLVNVTSAVNRTEDLGVVVTRIDRAVRLVPSNPVPYFVRSQANLIRAQVLISDKKNEEATTLLGQSVRDAEAGIAQDPKNAMLYSTLGTVYKTVGTYITGTSDQILAAYNKAVELSPNNPWAHFDLGQSHYLVALSLSGEDKPDTDAIKTRAADAKTEFDRALTLYPNLVDAGFGLVLVDELTGQKDEALARLLDLTTKNSSSAALWYELGNRYFERKDDVNAKLAYEAAVKLQPSFSPIHEKLGDLAQRSGDNATARAEYGLVLQLDPTNDAVSKKLEALPKE